MDCEHAMIKTKCGSVLRVQILLGMRKPLVCCALLECQRWCEAPRKSRWFGLCVHLRAPVCTLRGEAFRLGRVACLVNTPIYTFRGNTFLAHLSYTPIYTFPVAILLKHLSCKHRHNHKHDHKQQRFIINNNGSGFTHKNKT